MTTTDSDLIADLLTPLQEQRKHEEAILATLPMPKYRNLPSREMFIYDFVNELEGASEKRVSLYRDTWAPPLSGVLIVHEEGPGRYGLIDGRHRFLAMKFKPVMFHCAIFSGLTREQIVALFLFHNQHRRNPGIGEKYRAAVAVGDPMALAIETAITTQGVGGRFHGYGAAFSLAKRCETLPDVTTTLSTAFRWLKVAFPETDTHRLDATLVDGVGRFALAHGGNPRITEERMTRVLTDNGRMTASHLKHIGTVTGSSARGAGGAICRHLEETFARYSGGHRL